MSALCTLSDVLAVLAPGEQTTYSDIIERLKKAGRPTAGVGVILEPYTEPHHGRASDELRCWMSGRFYDFDVEGTWSKSTLMVARKPANPSTDL